MTCGGDQSPPAVPTLAPRLCVSLNSAHTVPSQIWGPTLFRGGKQVTEHLKEANCRSQPGWNSGLPPYFSLHSQLWAVPNTSHY